MLPLSHTVNKRAIRQRWDKVLIAEFSESIGSRLAYFGLPGRDIADLLDWKEHIDWITGVELLTNVKGDVSQQQRETINALQSKVMLHGLNERWELRPGKLENIILTGTDFYGTKPARFTLERGKTSRLDYDLYNWDFQGGLHLNGSGGARRVEAIKHCINLQKHHSFLFLLTLNVRHTLGNELSTYLAGERGDVDLKQKKQILDWYKAQGSKSSSERFRLKVVVPLFIRKVAEVASFDCHCYPAIYYQGPSEHLLHFVFKLTAQVSALPVHSKQSRSEVLELPLLEVSNGKFDLAKIQHPGHNPTESCTLLSNLGFKDLII